MKVPANFLSFFHRIFILTFALSKVENNESTALFELRSKIDIASAKSENEFSLCIRLKRSLTYCYTGHTRKAVGILHPTTQGV